MIVGIDLKFPASLLTVVAVLAVMMVLHYGFGGVPGAK